ncbi:MAG: polysaccharide biosynthesis tyrosine autokinase [Bacteroidota bacterium]
MNNGFTNGSNGPSKPAGNMQMHQFAPPPVQERRINIYDYIQIILRGKWIILAAFLTIFVASAYYTWTRPSVYEAKSKMIISSKQNDAMSIFKGMGGTEERGIKNELEVMKSFPLLVKTAELLLDRKYIDTNSKAEVLPIITHKDKRNADLRKSHYDTLMSVASQLGSIIQLSPVRDADVVEVTTRTNHPVEAAIIANTFVESYQTDNEENSRSNARRLRTFLEEQAGHTKDTLLRAESQQQSYMSANKAVQVDEQSAAIIAKLSDFDSKYNEARINAESTKKVLNEYQSRLKEVEPEFSDNLAAAANPYIESLQMQIAQLEVQKDFIIAEKPTVGSQVWLNNTMKDNERQLAELRNKLRIKTEEVRKSKLGSLPINVGNGKDGSTTSAQGLQGLKQKIFELGIQGQSEEARMRALETARNQAEGDFSRIPGQMIDLAKLQRKTSGAVKLNDLLTEKLSEATIAEQSVFGNVRIFEPAMANPNPVSPNRPMNLLLGALVGLGIGIGLVVFRSLSDTTIRTPEELENRGLTVLAAIPKIPADLTASDAKQLLKKDEGVEFYDSMPPDKILPSHLISHANPKSPIAESYRSVRTSIQFAATDKDVKVVLISSSVPQEGKSTTSTNIAITLAQSGNRTVIVDCDLRRPVAHNTFNIGKEPGLVNALVGKSSILEVARPTGIKNLDVITSGPIPPNPSELLGSRKMKELLAELSEHYDSIILDTPPIVAVTDAVILAGIADAYILVTRANVTQIEIIQKSREAMERASNKFLGVVLNDFDVSNTYGSYYKYYRYYKYYNYYGDNAEATNGDAKKGAKVKA